MSDVLILGYHAVSESWESALSVTPANLERQLASLVRQGYRGAPFHEAVSAPSTGKTLVVTFDDAYRSVRELALPILERLDLPGTVFVPTQFAGGGRLASWPGVDVYLGGPNEHELAVMSWEELAGLTSMGWEVGSHTRSHPRLTQLEDATLMEELQGLARRLRTRARRPLPLCRVSLWRHRCEGGGESGRCRLCRRRGVAARPPPTSTIRFELAANRGLL